MVGWHHGVKGREFEQSLGGSEGQGSLVHCTLWGHKESETLREQQNSLGKVKKPTVYQLGVSQTLGSITTCSPSDFEAAPLHIMLQRLCFQ